MHIAAAEILRDGGDGAKFVGVDDAVGVAQPAHEGVLRGRHVEQAVEFVQEDVGALREFALRGVYSDLVPHVERVLRAFRFLFLGKLSSRGEHALLRREMNVLRPYGFGRGSCGLRCARDCKASTETF